jgi:hypothetical protein
MTAEELAACDMAVIAETDPGSSAEAEQADADLRCEEATE